VLKEREGAKLRVLLAKLPGVGLSRRQGHVVFDNHIAFVWCKLDGRLIQGFRLNPVSAEVLEDQTRLMPTESVDRWLVNALDAFHALIEHDGKRAVEGAP